MATKTVDETGAKSEEEGAKATEATEAAETAGTADTAEDETAGAEAQDTVDEDDEYFEAGDEQPEAAGAQAGVGQGAGAVVSVALGVVSLTGSWLGTVASARETLIGQLRTSSSASVAQQIKEVYGDAWQTTALIGGVFALLALIVGALVLIRPLFGAPVRPQAAWIKSVAWAGVSLGALGLLLAVAKYSDILFGLPSPS
ncbi:hypothetical protein [Streptomyces cavernae]|uniref:hypothetical protein n=1 Tax=Streptomyces cavernae TaxID=2259034 RepID=UPI000FEBE162|nr:hypothetical protein [Streptomyces cavernae]